MEKNITSNAIGTRTGDRSNVDAITSHAQPVLNRFYDAVRACDREPPFKPSIQIATSPGPIRYDHAERSVVLVPYELLDPATKVGMDCYAAIGTLSLSGRAQYEVWVIIDCTIHGPHTSAKHTSTMELGTRTEPRPIASDESLRFWKSYLARH